MAPPWYYPEYWVLLSDRFHKRCDLSEFCALCDFRFSFDARWVLSTSLLQAYSRVPEAITSGSPGPESYPELHQRLGFWISIVAIVGVDGFLTGTLIIPITLVSFNSVFHNSSLLSAAATAGTPTGGFLMVCLSSLYLR